MTTINQAREAIYQRFVDQWGAVYPFAFDNESYEPADLVTPWVRVTVKNTVSGQETSGKSGTRKYIRKGIILVQIFTPSNSGTSQSDTLMTKAQAIFEGFSFSGMWTNDSLLQEIGVEGDWYQSLAQINFFYEETK